VIQYKHPDNKDIPYVDWRLPENRKEMFFRWLEWRLRGWNIDHFLWNTYYTQGLTDEQKFWYAFLFGMTYQASQAWIFYSTFPDFQNLDLKELDRWNRETMPRQKFATDTRYNKGHIVKIVQSLQDWVNVSGQGSIKKAFESRLVEDEMQSYHNVNESIRGLHKFGRMTAWLYAQCLYECCGLPIKPNTMFTDDPSNVSVWNGAMYYQGMEHHTVGDPPKFAGYKPTARDREDALVFERELMAEAQDRIESKQFLSYFTLETHLCQFKKLNVGHDYPGQNIGDAITRFEDFKVTWPEIDFSPFQRALDDKIYSNIKKRESKQMMHLFQKTGQPIHMNNLYSDLPSMEKELGLFGGESEEQIKACIERYTNNESVSGLECFFE
jgi:hypothetical protein